MRNQTRIIPWENVLVHDTVRATWKQEDATKSAEGQVAYILASGVKRSFYTDKGVKLFTVTTSGSSKVTIELLKRPTVTHEGMLW